jgi:membrane protease YdiL (CAAX protease family)
VSGRAAGTIRAVTAIVFLAAAVAAFQFPRWKTYWLVLFACFTAALSLLMATQFGHYGLEIFSLAPATPAGIAVGKLSETVIVLFFVLILAVAARSDLASVYLARGDLRRGFTVGLAAFAVLLAAGVVRALVGGVGPGRLVAWAPWILVWVLAKAFVEELLYRGLFLKRLEPILGARPANALTALVFAGTYTASGFASNAPVFAAIAFVLGLVWGHIIQKTDNLWGTWLFHAGAEVAIAVGVMGSL